MKYAKIISSGMYVPQKIMSNAEFEKKTLFTIDPYFSEVIGINHRHVSEDWETPTYMAAEAAKKALQRIGMSPEEIDLIIVGTDTPESISPPDAPRVQYLIGAHKAEPLAFNVNASCANGALMLDIAARYIAMGDYKNVLVVGTYAMTKFLSWKYSWEALFSDGAGALILTASDEPGFIGSVSRADGSWWQNWGIYMGAGTMNLEGFERGLHKLDLRAAYPATVNEEGWPMLINKLMEKYNLTKEEIGVIFFTQVRKKTIEKVMDILGLPIEKTHMIMHKYGYTGSACVYMAYDDALGEGKLNNLEGKVVIFLTSGVGFQQVATAFRV
ncbi:ketoacyl-ACP synthase III [Fervidobacterium riparium]|uniref:3-oxoacyl-ACP synthase III family protein n=1 Tax=Fervidobacterium gondwanense TaxID=44754 RepID=UPI002208D16F|nr:3-ketoacyl-ACP synthase [Fervidobacterium riparium]